MARGATKQPFEQLWEAFGGQMAIVSHFGLKVDPQLPFDTGLEFAGSILRLTATNRGLCLLVNPTLAESSHPDTLRHGTGEAP